MTSAGAKIAVLFEPDAELTSRLNNEKEFRFVEVPTEEGKQDAEEPEPGTTEPGGEGPNGGETPDPNAGGGETPGGNGGGGNDDVFNTDLNNRESLLDGVISKSDNIIDARYIRFSMRYSFNRKNLKRFENHQGSNADSGRL